jgi:diguanylate cyclase (GGDEF)-like protein
MHTLTPALSPSEPDLAMLNTLTLVKRICLVTAELFSLLALCQWIIPSIGLLLPGTWQSMSPGAAVSVLCSAFSLELSEPQHSKWARRVSLALAAVVVVLALFTLMHYGIHLSLNVDSLNALAGASQRSEIGGVSPQTANAFVLLGISMILLQAHKRPMAYVADLAIFLLCFLVMVMVSAEFFGALRIFGPLSSIPVSPESLLCLLLLTVVAAFRQAEHGVFAIVLGRGIGGRVARLASPILILIPFLREAARAHFISSASMPPNYTTAILVSLTATLSFMLLLFIAWRINRMEMQIHNLSLRDELTGLYNLRGFHLLAEQTLRLAQRSRLPFSVLFIDVDNLKQINDSFGHSAGSATLRDTGDLIKSTFRETDVMGRVGGDEFAVAGQFSEEAISVAIHRLREASTLRNSGSKHRPEIGLSIGHVTSAGTGHEPLDELLTRADDAMYEEKRRKKLATGVKPS